MTGCSVPRLQIAQSQIRTLNLTEATIDGALNMDGTVCGDVHLERAKVTSVGPIQLVARSIYATRAQLLGKTHLRILCSRGASLQGAHMGDHCVIERSLTPELDSPPGWNELPRQLPVYLRLDIAKRLHELHNRLTSIVSTASPTKILDLRRASVAGLSLSQISLTDCQLTGAHELDKIRIDSTHAFNNAAATTKRWHTSRAVIAEERTIRNTPTNRASSTAPGITLPALGPPSHDAVASAYRDLRKSFEDAKDEPGAAGFYYGEMEMRRLGSPIVSPGRWLLTTYWLISGAMIRTCG